MEVDDESETNGVDTCICCGYEYCLYRRSGACRRCRRVGQRRPARLLWPDRRRQLSAAAGNLPQPVVIQRVRATVRCTKANAMPRVMAKVTGTTESVTLNRPGTPSYRDLELTRGRFSGRLEFFSKGA